MSGGADETHGPTEIVRVEAGAAAETRGALERCIAAGGVAVFPSDGLYGLAAIR